MVELIRDNVGLGELSLIAETLAFYSAPGDLITLSGELGAGKTTFARAYLGTLMREVAGDEDCDFEVPSPTFSLVQGYEDLRIPVAHFDLYRLSDADELHELGLDLALGTGVALVEWPEMGADQLPPATFAITIADVSAPGASADEAGDLRRVVIRAPGRCDAGTGATAAGKRLDRLAGTLEALDTAGLKGGDCQLTFLTGDASHRRYARLSRRRWPAGHDLGQDDGHENRGLEHRGQSAVRDAASCFLMDWPEQPDGPPVRDGKPYSRIAHIAENVSAFIAVDAALRAAGLAAPEIRAQDVSRGLLVLEDLGANVFDALSRRGEDQRAPWTAAVDVLLRIRSIPLDGNLKAPGLDQPWPLPRYDRAAMAIETELLLDWYWPEVKGLPADQSERADFALAWAGVFDDLMEEPGCLVLRDFHSPNLIWRAERDGHDRVGLIDFQDAVAGPAAYDLVSLLQDARVDVDAGLERDLLNRYCERVAHAEPDFDMQHFRYIYACLGAQRATKILGIFTRLAVRDNKPKYLAHIPRVWSYLDRNLAHPRLEELRSWFDVRFPGDLRGKLPAAPDSALCGPLKE